MTVIVTPDAEAVLHSRKPEPGAVLRVAAMDEGCGCGATVLFEMNWDHAHPADLLYEAGADLTVAMDAHSQIYFTPELMIDYHPETDTFVLKNHQQIFLNHIHI